MTDILELIDATLDGKCACGCGVELNSQSNHMWFATEACQIAYNEHRNDPAMPSPDERRAEREAARLRRRAQERMAQEGREYGRWRQEQLLGNGWLSAREGPVAWIRECPNCRTFTRPEDAIRPAPHSVDWFTLTTDPMVDTVTIRSERCNACTQCRRPWPGPALTAYYRAEHDERLAPGYVLRLESPTHKCENKIATSFLTYERDRAVAYVWHEMERHLADLALPECVVPDCTERGRMVFTAAEPGRLAGRVWAPGDEIRVCPCHGNDIYLAHGAYGLDQLAEWIRPDARLDVLDAYDADAYGGDQIRRDRAHMLRIAVRGRP